MPTPIKYFFEIRNGRSLSPEALIDGLKQKYGSVTLSSVPLSQLVYDNEIVSEKVFAIQKAMREGSKMPPIVVDHDSEPGFYRVLDGNHRAAACHREGLSDIEAYVPGR